MRPKIIPFLATRCLYMGAYGGDGCGRVHLTKHHPDPQADDLLCWPAVVPLLTTRCLYWGWGGSGGVMGADRGCWGLHMKIKTVYCKVLVQTQESIADNRTWAQVNGTQVRTTLGHQMLLPAWHWGGIWRWWVWQVHLTKHHPDQQADDPLSWPALVTLLTTRCLY